MFNFFQHETGAELIWALLSFDPWDFCWAEPDAGTVMRSDNCAMLRQERTRTCGNSQTRRPSETPTPSPHVPLFDWRFHSGRCGRSCLRARWRRLTGLFMQNNWDSWTECWTNSAASCYTTARFHHFTNSPLIRPSSKPFLISTFI